LDLAWRRTSDTQWTLELTSPDATLQGLHLRADLPDGVGCRTSEGLLIAQQVDPVFLRDTGALDISLAILGRGRCFTGAGALIDLEFSAPYDPSRAVIQARGMDNRDLVIHLKSDGEKLPGAFALLGNFPNPFNPSTTIEYELPRDAFVRLAVYGMDGGLVRTLVADEMIAGRHATIWDGKNTGGETVASGLYFYRFDAGNCNTTRKMLLIK
jgi:flagellar hook capping protein FlgD